MRPPAHARKGREHTVLLRSGTKLSRLSRINLPRRRVLQRHLHASAPGLSKIWLPGMDSNHRPDGKQPFTLPLSYQGIEPSTTSVQSPCRDIEPGPSRSALTSMLKNGQVGCASG